MIRLVAALATMLVALVPSASAATTADRQLDAAMKKLVAMKGGPPGAISVVQRDGQRKVHRAGVANLRHRTPLRSTDHMRIASMSKAFSGAVALSRSKRACSRSTTPSPSGCRRFQRHGVR